MTIEIAKVPVGNRLPTLEEYIHFLVPISYHDENCKINFIGMVTSGSDDDLYGIEYENRFTLLPGPEFNPRLYRGQTKYYDPCLPTLYRNATQISIFVSILKNFEFYKFLLGSHPIIYDLQQWVISGKHYHIDLEGLAQHYELSTTFIDVTRSKDVALFFAYCYKNPSTGKYEPILDASHNSILYTVDFASLVKHDQTFFNPIGFQGLSRPEAQKACSIPLKYGIDFNKLPHVSYEVLKINPSESKKYFELFDGGRKLFPEDPTSDIAKEIKESSIIDADVLENVFRHNLIPPYFATTKDAKKFLESNGYSVREKSIALKPEIRKQVIEDWLRILPNISNKLKFRFVSEPLRTDP